MTMKKAYGSAFIPDGLLPKFSDDPAHYRRVYSKLRWEHDAAHRAHRRARDRKNYRAKMEPDERTTKERHHE